MTETRTTADDGPLTRTVLAYVQTMSELVTQVPTDWAPLERYVAVDDFERVGTFLEVQNWQQYTEMLTRWASTIDAFEAVVRRISELSGLVYYEVEEHHRRGDDTHVVNSMTVFEFDDDGRIHHLDVFLQSPR